MTFDQVKQLLGPPDLREVKPKTQAPAAPTDAPVDAPMVESWHYFKDDGRLVLFEGGQVVSFGRDDGKSGGDALAASGAEGVGSSSGPRPIGESCRLDKDCLGKNCHFHVCSGPNNCQVPVGGVCANNQDCCGGFCDFSICKQRLSLSKFFKVFLTVGRKSNNLS